MLPVQADGGCRGRFFRGPGNGVLQRQLLRVRVETGGRAYIDAYSE